MSTVVPSIRTPLSVDEASSYLRSAVFDRGGDEALARLIIAQSHLETGGWNSVWNYNLGNVRGTYEGKSMAIPGATEYDDDGNLVVRSSGFRAYPSFAQAAADKVDQLVRNFPGAWAAREPSAFVDGLWTGRLGSYFGVPPSDPFGAEGIAARDRYERVLRERYGLLFGEVPGEDRETPLPKARGGAASPFSSSAPSGQRLLRVAREGDADLVTLRFGSYGALVVVWQSLIDEDLKRDGDFGPKTVLATKRLQTELGLKPDGVVGPITWTRVVT